MKTKLMVIFFAVASAVNADPSWKGQNGSGFIDDESMWSASPPPIYSTTTAAGGRNYAQVWPGSDWASTMFLRNMAIFNGGFSVNMQPGYDNTLDFDGAGVTLVHGDVPEGMNDRNVVDVFFCENGSGGDYRWFNCGVGDKRHSAYLWSNAWFRISHRQMTPGFKERLDAVNGIDFGRGRFLWGGTNLADMVGTTTVNAGVSNGGRTEMTITNSTVVFNALDWQGRIARSTLLVDGPDARMVVLRHANLGFAASSTQPGTNLFTVSGGATMQVDATGAASSDFTVGAGAVSPQSSVLTVTGAGSLIDCSASNRGMKINDGGALVVTNGGCARMKTGLSISKVEGNPGGVIRVAGEYSSLEFGAEGGSGEAVLTVDGGEESVFEQTGGRTKSNHQGRRISVYLGQNGGRCGTLRISGGTFDMGEGGTHGLLRVGMAGSGTLDVSGGSIVGCGNIALAERDGATGLTTNVFRQTGGYVEALDSGVTCNKAADAKRHVFIELLGGTLCAYRISGGAGADNPEKDHTEFYADGGTLISGPNGLYHVTYPFFYGFNRVELGEKGLTLSVRGTCNVKQRFTNRKGATGRLFVTGNSACQIWFEGPDGGDNAELVVGGATARIGNAMTNWQTTVVVTNGACFDVSAVDRLSLKGLTLGSAVSPGTVRVAPTNRVSMAAFAFEKAIINLDGAFLRDTDYPLFTVEGQIDGDGILAWRSADVTGAVPSGCVPRFSFTYSEADDATTVTLRIEESVEPDRQNVWSGAAGGQSAFWGNPDCWSDGVPTASSRVELSSGDSAPVIDVPVAALGALAFTSLRDYVISGDGILFFEDGNVDAVIDVAGGDQRIDVPVGSVRNLSVKVADGASLTFGGKIVTSSGGLIVNGERTSGRVVLEGAGSAFGSGITHCGGVLDVSSAEVFGAAVDGLGNYTFKGYGLLRVAGDPAEDPYRLPFGFLFQGGSSANTTWGSAVVIDTDRALVVPPYVTSMTGGGSLVKFGRAPLVFETCGDTVLTLAIANGTAAWNNAQLPQNSVFTYDETTGKAVSDKKAYGGVNVYEGELVYRGADDTIPTDASSVVRNGFGTVIGFRTTNSVDVTPGLVLDRVYADFGEKKHSANAQSDLSYVSLAQDAHDLNGPFPHAATNAYLALRNGSTLATGRLRVGATTFDSSGFLHVSPRIVVDGSTLRAVTGIDFAARAKVHADWRVGNGSTLLSGTNAVVWAGEAHVSVGGGSFFSGTGDGPAAIALGADARGTLSVTGGSRAHIGDVTAADGAAVEFIFDGGSLSGCADGGTISFPDAVALSAGADGLHINVPAGETWTLGRSVAGSGFVTLGGDGTLALSGKVTAGFAGGGTVSGGMIENGRLRADVSGASGVPTFVGTEFSGRVEVDLGLGSAPLARPYPTDVEVASFTGCVPPVSAFRRTGAGVGADGRRLFYVFKIKDGVVTADVVDNGLTLIVR